MDDNTKNKTAGRILTTAVASVKASDTIAQVEQYLIKEAKNLDTISYIYVLDRAGVLVGAISIRELFGSPKQSSVEDVMTRNPVTARASTHQERIARMAIKHNLKAVPIVDQNNMLLGAVTSRTIFNILHEENIEDFLLSEGVHGFDEPSKSLLSASPFKYFGRRLPWLLFGLAGGALAAVIVRHFEETISSMLLLAAFLPMVVYIADAVGGQSQMIFIRSMATDWQLSMRPYIIREAKVTFALAVSLSIAAGLVSMLWEPTLTLFSIIALSFFATIIFSSAVAIILPLIFVRLKYDPAVASGPLGTVIRDISTVIIYFAIATLVLGLA